MNPLSKADASVIVLAKEQQALVILTRDRNLRRRARREGIRFATLFDVLLSAKERGVVQAIKPLLDAMGDKGIAIREGVYQDRLRRAGELEDLEG